RNDDVPWLRTPRAHAQRLVAVETTPPAYLSTGSTRPGDLAARDIQIVCLSSRLPGLRSFPMSSALRSTATAVTAVLTALPLTACTTGDNAGTEVSFQFHLPGGETEILYEEDQRAPLPDFSGPSLMEEGETINLSDFE